MPCTTRIIYARGWTKIHSCRRDFIMSHNESINWKVRTKQKKKQDQKEGERCIYAHDKIQGVKVDIIVPYNKLQEWVQLEACSNFFYLWNIFFVFKICLRLKWCMYSFAQIIANFQIFINSVCDFIF